MIKILYLVLQMLTVSWQSEIMIVNQNLNKIINNLKPEDLNDYLNFFLTKIKTDFEVNKNQLLILNFQDLFDLKKIKTDRIKELNDIKFKKQFKSIEIKNLDMLSENQIETEIYKEAKKIENDTNEFDQRKNYAALMSYMFDVKGEINKYFDKIEQKVNQVFKSKTVFRYGNLNLLTFFVFNWGEFWFKDESWLNYDIFPSVEVTENVKKQLISKISTEFHLGYRGHRGALIQTYVTPENIVFTNSNFNFIYNSMLNEESKKMKQKMMTRAERYSENGEFIVLGSGSSGYDKTVFKTFKNISDFSSIANHIFYYHEKKEIDFEVKEIENKIIIDDKNYNVPNGLCAILKIQKKRMII
jgi:hypothetical protein